jgi:hypothetical protein
MTAFKAAMTFVAVFLSAALAEWTGGTDAVRPRDMLIALGAALGSGVLVYLVPNTAMTAAKAFTAFAVTFVAALLVEWTGGSDAFALRDLIVALSTSLGSATLVYAVPNTGTPAPA